MKESEQGVKFPWWGNVILAVMMYCFFHYFAPLIDTGSVALNNFLHAGPMIAPVITIPLLLLAAKQLYDDAPSSQDPPEDDGDQDDVQHR